MTNQTIHPCPKCEVVPEVDLCYTPTSVVVCCQLHPAYSVDTVLWVDLCDLHLGRACRELGVETVEQLKAKVQPDPRVAELSGYITVLLDLATDAANGLEYVRDVHGDLYGVGFDRVKIKAEVLPVIRLKMTQLISAPRGEG